MDNTPTRSQNIVLRRYDALPQEAKDMLVGLDINSIFDVVREKYVLSPETVAKVKRFVRLTLVGSALPEKFSDYLAKETVVPDTERQELVADVADALFMPFTEVLSMFRKENEELERKEMADVVMALGKKTSSPVAPEKVTSSYSTIQTERVQTSLESRKKIEDALAATEEFEKKQKFSAPQLKETADFVQGLAKKEEMAAAMGTGFGGKREDIPRISLNTLKEGGAVRTPQSRTEGTLGEPFKLSGMIHMPKQPPEESGGAGPKQEKL